MDNKKVWIIGVGGIGQEYAKILTSLECEYVAIGRGEESAKKFQDETSHTVETGGLESFLSKQPELPSAAIIAVRIEQLVPMCTALLDYGVKRIFVEKPAIAHLSEINEIDALVDKYKAEVFIAYNRRFYASVLKAEEIIKEDGGVSSFNFEFTEWSHEIATLPFSEKEFQSWLMGNSSHVIDTAFFLGGQPKEIVAFTGGENKLTWHPTTSIFAGAGVTENGALFNYGANWIAPGRWVIEILTAKHRLYFKPMEQLQIQNIGSVAVNAVEGIDYSLDSKFKPGFYLQTKAFLEGNTDRLCTIKEQKEHIDNYYKQISGY